MSLDRTDPIAVLLAGADALAQAGIRTAAYGGLVLAVYGEPRETRDADLAVVGANGAAATAAMVDAGLTASLTFDHVGFGGLFITRIALVGGGELNTVDLIEPRVARYAQLVLDRSVRGRLRGRELDLVTAEDFVILMVLSTRERDLEDARTVMDRADAIALDVDLIDQELALLATELLGHDVAGRWSRLRAAG